MDGLTCRFLKAISFPQLLSQLLFWNNVSISLSRLFGDKDHRSGCLKIMGVFRPWLLGNSQAPRVLLGKVSKSRGNPLDRQLMQLLWPNCRTGRGLCCQKHTFLVKSKMLQEELERSSHTSRPGSVTCLAPGLWTTYRTGPLCCFLVHRSSEVQSKQLNKSICKDVSIFSLDMVVLDGWPKQGESFQACIERAGQDYLLWTDACKRYKDMYDQCLK